MRDRGRFFFYSGSVTTAGRKRRSPNKELSRIGRTVSINECFYTGCLFCFIWGVLFSKGDVVA